MFSRRRPRRSTERNVTWRFPKGFRAETQARSEPREEDGHGENIQLTLTNPPRWEPRDRHVRQSVRIEGVPTEVCRNVAFGARSGSRSRVPFADRAFASSARPT